MARKRRRSVMPDGDAGLWPWVAGAALAFAVYRRLRRTFGRQPLRPKRLAVRIALLCVLGIATLPAACRTGQSAALAAAGIALGIALGTWAARLTRFEMHGGRLHYVPHTPTGVLVTLLFLGRLAYRLPQLLAAGAASSGPAPADPWLRSPLTLGLLFLLVGHYLCYYVLIVRRSTRLQPADHEPRPLATGP